MPSQAYWGALFARLFGYSFSSLRVSTLVLAAFGLIAFYQLAKEHGLDDIQAGLLTLGLLASPLVLRTSFTFMTDVPFLACLLIALYRWLTEQREQAQYWVTETREAPGEEQWAVLKEIPYRDILLRERRVYVVRRGDKSH